MFLSQLIQHIFLLLQRVVDVLEEIALNFADEFVLVDFVFVSAEDVLQVSL